MLPEGMTSLCYYPLFSKILADGTLQMSTAGTLESGEKFDGARVIGKDHSHYDEWIDLVRGKLAHLDQIHDFEPEITWLDEPSSQKQIVMYDSQYPGERKYGYVGSPELKPADSKPQGQRVRTALDLQHWISKTYGRLALGRTLTLTYVIDLGGYLRVVERENEHVRCAGGAPVRGAGEIGIDLGKNGTPVAVVEVSNQSTGYCPEATSWGPVKRALEILGLPYPPAFTSAFEFRRCPSCTQLNLVKDGLFECAACESELPEYWNCG